MSKLTPRRASGRLAHTVFLDPATGEIVSDVDVHGREIIGCDAHGLWWGTERACWLLDDAGGAVVTIVGRIGDMAYDGYFIGTPDAALSYVLDHGVRDAEVISVETE